MRPELLCTQGHVLSGHQPPALSPGRASLAVGALCITHTTQLQVYSEVGPPTPPSLDSFVTPTPPLPRMSQSALQGQGTGSALWALHVAQLLCSRAACVGGTGKYRASMGPQRPAPVCAGTTSDTPHVPGAPSLGPLSCAAGTEAIWSEARCSLLVP